MLSCHIALCLTSQAKKQNKKHLQVEGLGLSPCLEMPGGPPGIAGGSGWGEGHLELPPEAAAPTTRISDRRRNETYRYKKEQINSQKKRIVYF